MRAVSVGRHLFANVTRGRLVAAAFVVCAVALGLFYVHRNANSFEFLFDHTGWEIGFSVLPFASSDPYWWAFVVGAVNTLVAGLSAIVGATALGFLIGLARSSGSKAMAYAAQAYVDIVRNVPVILQAMFWYAMYLAMPPAREAIAFAGFRITNRGFYIPVFKEPLVAAAFALMIVVAAAAAAVIFFRVRRRSFVGIRSSWFWAVILVAAAAGAVWLLPRLPAAFVIDWPKTRGLNIQGGFRFPIEFAALVTALVAYRSAFVAEIFRGGLRSVSRGHIDAAHALGLRAWPILIKVRIPLALMTILPPLGSEFLVIMKITSIGLLVGFTDLYSVSVNASTLTGRTLEIMALMTATYLVINFAIASVMNLINERVALRGTRRT